MPSAFGMGFTRTEQRVLHEHVEGRSQREIARTTATLESVRFRTRSHGMRDQRIGRSKAITRRTSFSECASRWHRLEPHRAQLGPEC
jgi:hypothetical protein